MRIVKNILVVIWFQLFISCDRQDAIIPNFKHCITNDSRREISLNCIQQGIDSMFFCENIYLGQLKLNDASKIYQPYFCFEPGPIRKFVSSTGEHCTLFLRTKLFDAGTSGWNSKEFCRDSSRRTSYCYDTENALVELRLEELDIDLGISLQPRFDFYDSTYTKFGYELNFARKSKQFNNTSYVMYGILVNPGTASYKSYFTQHFFTSINILNREFKNVFTSDFWLDKNADPKPFEIFYNSEFGIVSFIDDSGSQWRLED